MCDTGNRGRGGTRAVILGCVMSGRWNLLGLKFVRGWYGCGVDTAGAYIPSALKMYIDSDGPGITGQIRGRLIGPSLLWPSLYQVSKTSIPNPNTLLLNLDIL